MTLEDKELLFKDLCARLTYGVKIKIGGYSDYTLYGIIPNADKPIIVSLVEKEIEHHIDVSIENIKPYLRPVSSMTDIEMDTLFDILHIDKKGHDDDWIKINDVTRIKFFLPSGRWMEEMDNALRYLRSIHIDIYSFIGKGIALEAPQDMYN